MVVDYQQGKIYKVASHLGDLIYIGSTCQKLNERFNKHRSGFKGNILNTVNIVFSAYGVENCKIELMETCPCNSKKELATYEGKHQRENKCVNKAIADRDRKEYQHDTKEKWIQYRVDNKEHIRALKAANYQKNKEHIKQKAKEHYKANREKKIEYQKQYQIDNAEKVKKYKHEHHKKTKLNLIT